MTRLSKNEPAADLSGRLAAENAFFGPLCTALAIATGIAVAWGALAGWLGSSLFSRNRAGLGRIRRGEWRRHTSGRPDGPDHSRITRDIHPRSQAGRLRPSTSIQFPPPRCPADWRRSRCVSEAEPTLFHFFDNRKWGTNWYFVAFGNPEGHGYFAGYDVNTRQLVGYIGQADFKRPSRTRGGPSRLNVLCLIARPPPSFPFRSSIAVLQRLCGGRRRDAPFVSELGLPRRVG